MSEEYRTRRGNHITVTNGPSARVRAQLDEMRAAARTLDQLASSLHESRNTVLRIMGNLPPLGMALSPGTHLKCQEHLVCLLMGDRRLSDPTEASANFARMLRDSVETYEDAEADAAHRMQLDVAGRSFRQLAGLVPDVIAHPGVLQDPDRFLTELLEENPEITRSVSAVVDLLAPMAGGYAGALAWLGRIGLRHQKEAGPVTVTETAHPGHGCAPPATGIGSSATRINDLHHNGADAAHIQVQRTVDRHGHGRWVVLVPGTQDFGFNEANPADGTGNLVAVAGMPNAMTGAVTAALEKAQRSEKVYGKHEPVMLVGHSQGGMVAANLARDPAMRRRFTISKVVTLGAPVGHLEPGTRQLDILNTRDAVPALSGTRTGERDPERTRISIDDPRSMTDSDGERQPMAPHDAKNYGIDYTDAVTSSPASSQARRFDSDTRPYFDGQTHTYVYAAHRDVLAPAAERQPARPRQDLKISEKILHGPARR